MKLQRRIAFHFTLQFVILFVALFAFVIILMMFLANVLANEELKRNLPSGLVTNIPLAAVIKNDIVTLDDQWIDLLGENHMWLQILNEQGDVISAVNTPDSLPNTYTVNELLQIEEARTLNGYDVSTYYTSWLSDANYYLFGYYQPTKSLLDNWFERFGQTETVSAQDAEILQKELISHNGVLYIFKNGEIIQTLGEAKKLPTAPLSIIAMKHEPGEFGGEFAFHNSPNFNTAWALYIPKDDHTKKTWFFKKEVQITFLAGLISLIIAIILSFWNGYRYGRPLFMMVKWIDRIEAGQFEVFTEKEKRKVFKKSGKTRRKYRLYQEVIQALRTMAQKLDIANKERKQLEKTREEWMAGISHDIRTPLSSIHGYGHLLESNQYTFSPEEMQEIGKTIREKGDYIIQLVDDFSLVFELKNNALELNLEEIELNKFVQQSVQAFQKDLTIQPVELIFRGTENPLHALLDPKWFIRVLDNVIYNAIKHNPTGTQIQVNLFQDNFNHIIQIQDNGVGIDEYALETLFDRYHRGTNTRERKDGSGLGMNIAKGIVELHHGSIDVQSKLGEGTTITISLPK
ncbi:sensor histidine kinase [Bacillus ndiopicus]|uniref:sensor histidine kinase n=1 Tax=Bacillus ndiopicus TaxID=1347368 RepID=UPI0005A5EC7E|nr:HAMP domain-containing sensor histidine kinase [Bacillus ndiopicus]